VSRTLDWLSGELAGRDRRRDDLARLEGAISRLEATDGPVAAAEALRRIRRHLPAGRSVPGLEETLSRFREVMRSSPTDALKAWWVHIERTTVLSAARYRDMGRAWWAFRPPSMTARTERRAFLDAVRALRLDVDPADGAEEVFTALAGVLAADPSSPSWRRETDGGRLALAAFIERARNTAPSWLASMIPDVTLGEALPIGEDLGAAWRSLDRRPRLQVALTAAEPHPDADLERELLEWRQSVLADLRADAAERVAQDDEPRRIRDKALAQLLPLRRRLEDEALEWEMDRPKRRKPVGPDLAARLHRALDAYDAATRAIAFPHTRDPRVIRVPVASPLEEAAGLAGEDRRADGVARLQDLDEAVALDAERDRQHAVEEVSAASPAARLRAALNASLTPDRIAALAPDLASVVRNHRAADLLQALTRDELEGVASAIGVAPQPRAILVTLGLYSGGVVATATENARRLSEKSRSDDFDMFLAHNAEDKAAVLEIAERLREAGIHPWVDVEQVPPGEFFQDAIQKVVPLVKAAAVIVGRNGIGQWQALELRSFISQCVERAMPLIPVLLPYVDAIPAETPFLREFNAVRFGPTLNDDAALRGLVWGITGHRPDPQRRAAPA
jgi:hypothetical protein